MESAQKEFSIGQLVRLDENLGEDFWKDPFDVCLCDREGKHIGGGFCYNLGQIGMVVKESFDNHDFIACVLLVNEALILVPVSLLEKI